MSNNELTVRPKQEQLSVMTPQGYEAAMSFAKTLVDSGFLPKAIQKPAQALAIILAGQELGLPPMTSLRQIHIVEGKPTLSAELMLSLFKKRGGKAKWMESTDKKAVLWLRDANGDEHTETWTYEDAVKAEVAKKDNWRKYGKAMLRARCVSAGIRALGESDSIYTAEELGGDAHPDDLQTTEATIVQSPKAQSVPTASNHVAVENATKTIQNAPQTGDSTTDPKGPTEEQSRLSVVGAAPSNDVAPSTATSESAPQPASMPDKIRTTDAELAELAEPEDGEDVDYVDCWEFVRVSGHQKAGTLVTDWVPKGMCQRRTNRQNTKLHTLRSLLELTDADWHAGIKRHYNKESSRDLSIEEATDMISKLETRYNQRTYKTPTIKTAHKEEIAPARLAQLAADVESLTGITAVDLVQKTFNGATVVK